MLYMCVGMCANRSLEGQRAESTFVEGLTVSALDVGLQRRNIGEDPTAVMTAGGRQGAEGEKVTVTQTST